MCMVHAHLCIKFMQCQCRQKGIGSPGTEVSDGCYLRVQRPVPRSSTRATSILKHGAISPAHALVLIKIIRKRFNQASTLKLPHMAGGN